MKLLDALQTLTRTVTDKTEGKIRHIKVSRNAFNAIAAAALSEQRHDPEQDTHAESITVDGLKVVCDEANWELAETPLGQAIQEVNGMLPAPRTKTPDPMSALFNFQDELGHACWGVVDSVTVCCNAFRTLREKAVADDALTQDGEETIEIDTGIVLVTIHSTGEPGI